MFDQAEALDHTASSHPDKQSETLAENYWDANLRLIATLLAIWFAVSYLPVLIVQPLNQLNILTGFPLGYYMASQGSLIVFVVLIAYYAWRLTRLDEGYNRTVKARRR
jgi:putative solute:sodium symporter small subunit